MFTVSTLCFSGNFNLTLVWLNLCLGNTSRIVFAFKNKVKFLSLDPHQNGIFSNIKIFAQFHTLSLVLDQLIRLLFYTQLLDRNNQRFKICCLILLEFVIANSTEFSPR
ncbi:hypothetical protein PL11201_680247 [Planktothrix sp. PCC 11201]|uniref:hypothetical protein n=1 Tax=Planktothrix sp. PCC 11201 TaxID=1729650 RepID=UPI00091CAA03|nr:hypothetical protein [Planktothrix sp. PCC 11201]SKB14971.1 hypothetical protein PL11201_680247 [Planktothrix sp. PCC 11201]